MSDTSRAVARLLGAQDSAPDLSVVIPTFNRRLRLRQVLSCLNAQVCTVGTDDTFSFEVLVVSDGCTDGTPTLVREFDSTYPLRLIDQENAGPAAARNAGIEAASGEVVAQLRNLESVRYRTVRK